MDRKTYFQLPYLECHRFRIPPGPLLAVGREVISNQLLEYDYIEFWVDTRNWSYVLSIEWWRLSNCIKARWYQFRMAIKHGRQEW